jgi:chemotaxis protein MotB
MEKGLAPVIIKRRKPSRHGSHGGSWKVALADFMTAMMAFFLLLWLLGGTTDEEKRAISGYFIDPASPYVVGEGGADLGIINQERPVQQSPIDEVINQNDPVRDRPLDEERIKREVEALEREKLVELQKQLESEINAVDSVFQELKDQILIDFTALGLRIQIVDKDQRPMFAVGSTQLMPYSKDVLQALAPILNKVQNKISITGHTDAAPYGKAAVYTNWELSADRANSARRAMQEGTYPEAKVATVQGMGANAPYLAQQPFEPINRRIAIIV